MNSSMFKLIFLLVTTSQFLSSCYFVNYFIEDRTPSSGEGSSGSLSTVIGNSLGNKADSINEAALADVYKVSTTHAPAAIRPDPDMYVRTLLYQYHPPGSTVARQIGEVDSFRDLLGGASEDFAKKPQETYDATSLLATFKVTEVLCEGLLNPNEWEHPGWKTILPYAATETDLNLKFLAQRFLGRPSSKISDETIASLLEILDDNLIEGLYTVESYIPVCATLALDAEALLL